MARMDYLLKAYLGSGDEMHTAHAFCYKLASRAIKATSVEAKDFYG